jgi:hypothetical protein
MLNSIPVLPEGGVWQNLTLSEVIVTPCGDGSYCCGRNAAACCQNKGGYWIRNTTVFAYDGGIPEPFNSSKFMKLNSDVNNSTTTAAPAPAPGANNEGNINSKSQDAMKIGLEWVFLSLCYWQRIWWLLCEKNAKLEVFRCNVWILVTGSTVVIPHQLRKLSMSRIIL